MIRKTTILTMGLVLIVSLVISNAMAAPKLPTPGPTPVVPLDTVVAIVNDGVITQSELTIAMLNAKQELRSRHTPLPSNKTLRHQVLEQLIMRKLQLQIAKKANITVSNTELDKAITNIAKRNNLTLARLKQVLAKEGLSYSQFRKRIRDEMIVGQLEQQAVSSSIKVSNKEVSTYLKTAQQGRKTNEEYHLRNILIPLPGSPTSGQLQKAKQRAQKLVQQLRKGANFQALAAAQSGGQEAMQGGDLGWRKLGALPTIFAKRVVTMKTGDVAGPIRAANGFHIIKLVGERSSNGKLTENQVRMLIYRRKFEQQKQLWLQQLKGASYVKIVK